MTKDWFDASSAHAPCLRFSRAGTTPLSLSAELTAQGSKPETETSFQPKRGPSTPLALLVIHNPRPSSQPYGYFTSIVEKLIDKHLNNLQGRANNIEDIFGTIKLSFFGLLRSPIKSEGQTADCSRQQLPRAPNLPDLAFTP